MGLFGSMLTVVWGLFSSADGEGEGTGAISTWSLPRKPADTERVGGGVNRVYCDSNHCKHDDRRRRGKEHIK